MPRSLGFDLILTVGLFAACGTDTPAVPASDTASAASVDAEVEWFVDRAEATGLDYIHFNGMTGGFYTPEMMGPGVGLFDYDNDGDLDVYIPQGYCVKVNHSSHHRKGSHLPTDCSGTSSKCIPTGRGRCGL